MSNVHLSFRIFSHTSFPLVNDLNPSFVSKNILYLVTRVPCISSVVPVVAAIVVLLLLPCFCFIVFVFLITFLLHPSHALSDRSFPRQSQARERDDVSSSHIRARMSSLHFRSQPCGLIKLIDIAPIAQASGHSKHLISGSQLRRQNLYKTGKSVKNWREIQI